MLSEWTQSKTCQFEMLLAERNSDDGNAKHDTKYQMGNADPNAAQKYPKDIHDNADTTACLIGGPDFFSEWTQGKQAKF